MITALAKSNGTEDDNRRIVMELLLNGYPRNYEPSVSVMNRVKGIKQEINQGKFGDKLTIVAHKNFLKHFTATQFSEESKPIDGAKFDNAQVLLW